jgi:2-hydroxycyclohexanecarboxyl-CoA dehydrogenase
MLKCGLKSHRSPDKIYPKIKKEGGKMDIGLKDKVAFVTGTASQIGFGKAIALKLAGDGCNIAAADIDLEGAQKTADAIKAAGGKAIAVKVDITNKAEVDEAVKKALAEFGKIDILVNTAGLTAGGGRFLESTKEYWDKDVAVNYYGTMYCCQAVLPGMVERKFGRIVNFTSGVARSGGGSYAGAKAAVLTLTKGLATEFGPYGIHVNCIAPGPAPTNFGGGGIARNPDSDMVKGMTARFPLRRLTTADDIACAVTFLTSDLVTGTSGNTIAVGGSYMA